MDRIEARDTSGQVLLIVQCDRVEQCLERKVHQSFFHKLAILSSVILYPFYWSATRGSCSKLVNRSISRPTELKEASSRNEALIGATMTKQIHAQTVFKKILFVSRVQRLLQQQLHIMFDEKRRRLSVHVS